jgi:probable phosphoglycerate mutase
MRLILVRHAEPRPATTLAEDGLTDRGRAQALALAPALTELRAARVIASPTPRATETATLAGLPFEVRPEFEKFRYGNGEVGERRSVDVPLIDPDDRAAPDGETLAEFHERVASGYLELIEGDPDSTAIVIAHGGVGLVALRLAWHLGPRDPWLTDAVIPLASLTEITFEDAGRLTKIVRLGDVRHLSGLA